MLDFDMRRLQFSLFYMLCELKFVVNHHWVPSKQEKDRESGNVSLLRAAYACHQVELNHLELELRIWKILCIFIRYFGRTSGASLARMHLILTNENISRGFFRVDNNATYQNDKKKGIYLVKALILSIDSLSDLPSNWDNEN